MTGKFGTIVIDYFGWSWITTEPLTIKKQSDVLADLVPNCDEFWPSRGFINTGECMDFLYGCFAWD